MTGKLMARFTLPSRFNSSYLSSSGHLRTWPCVQSDARINPPTAVATFAHLGVKSAHRPHAPPRPRRGALCPRRDGRRALLGGGARRGVCLAQILSFTIL